MTRTRLVVKANRLRFCQRARAILGTLGLWLGGLGLLHGAALLPNAWAGTSSEEETLEWLDNYGVAIEKAKQTGWPIFLEFRCAP